MIKSNTKLNISLTLLLVALVIFVCENSLAQQTIETKYPGLFNGVLKLAVPAPLQADEVLVSEKVKITRSQLDSEINSSSKQIQSQLKENEFWVLENLATKKFITAEALEWSASKKIDTKNLKENDLILKYLGALTSFLAFVKQARNIASSEKCGPSTFWITLRFPNSSTLSFGKK